jgi:hypothetical protein
VEGGFSAASFANYRLPTSIVNAMEEAANFSLEKSTWASYKTAEAHVQRCEEATGVKIRFPMDDRMILTFVGWLISVRKVCAASVSRYLSGLRLVHLKHGVFPTNLRPKIVKSFIRGKSKEDKMMQKAPKLAITSAIMRLIEYLITRSSKTLEQKRLMWAVSCYLFGGSFRVHEVLARTEKEYDPMTTLLASDVNIHKSVIVGTEATYLKIHLKCPKKDRLGHGVTVELFATGIFSCPVGAFTKWKAVSKVAKARVGPMFRKASGVCYTGQRFNKDLKALLEKHIDYREKQAWQELWHPLVTVTEKVCVRLE